ncbi:MAG: CDP-alcohol phosphatidyltransferase family protein [Cyanobacteria bacterium HKST-UBA02]|nr:CDP-alcohol phosphatidyltransferase family protein [Cyanobacteria bacterium HKST-UBA02]
MRNIPNIITSVRLIAALFIATLCLAGNEQKLFLPLFVAAGVSDMLDGFIARRFNWCTDFGATLDSISDLALYLCVILFLAVSTPQAVFKCGAFVLVGGVVQVLHWAFCSAKLGGFPAYHTDFSRLCAYLIFGSVISFWLGRSDMILPAIACLWIACSVEGIIITAILSKRTSDVPGIFAALRQTREI